MKTKSKYIAANGYFENTLQFCKNWHILLVLYYYDREKSTVTKPSTFIIKTATGNQTCGSLLRKFLFLIVNRIILIYVN